MRGMNGVTHNYPKGHDYGGQYHGQLVNIITGEVVDRRIPIEQRAAALAAVRWHVGPAVTAPEVTVSEALTVEAAIAAATTPDAIANAPVSPAPMGVPEAATV